MVLCFADNLKIDEWSRKDTRWMTAYDMYKRRVDFSDYYYIKEDVFRVMRGFPNVNFRLIVQPSVSLSKSGAVIDLEATVDDVAAEIE